MFVASERDESIQSAVYCELKEAILGLHLKPGSSMSTQEIANRLQVSRTPVREAFIRLQREGLVLTLPQRGTMVSTIDLNRVEEERFIRESLEMAVIPLFLDHCSRADFVQLRYLIEQQKEMEKNGQFPEFVACDNHFHEILFRCAGQDLAWDTIANTNTHYLRIRVLTIQNRETLHSSICQHERLLNLLEQERVDDVRRELTSHVRKINYEKVELVRRYPDYFADQHAIPHRLSGKHLWENKPDTPARPEGAEE